MRIGVSTFLVVALSIAGNTMPAAGQDLPADPLPFYRMVALFKEACPPEHAALVKPGDEKRLAASAEEVMTFEIGRVRLLRPEATAASAREALLGHMVAATNGAEAGFLRHGCAGDRNTHLVTWVKTAFVDPEKIAGYKRLVETGVPYDKPRPLAATPNAPLTLAAPHFATLLIDGPLQGGATCKAITVNAIDLASRTPMPLSGAQQPPHIRIQQRIAENWTWTCDGVPKKSQVEFIQDDRSGRGSYSVIDLSPVSTKQDKKN